jgi:hypothetical protein
LSHYITWKQRPKSRNTQLRSSTIEDFPAPLRYILWLILLFWCSDVHGLYRIKWTTRCFQIAAMYSHLKESHSNEIKDQYKYVRDWIMSRVQRITYPYPCKHKRGCPTSSPDYREIQATPTWQDRVSPLRTPCDTRNIRITHFLKIKNRFKW